MVDRPRPLKAEFLQALTVFHPQARLYPLAGIASAHACPEPFLVGHGLYWPWRCFIYRRIAGCHMGLPPPPQCCMPSDDAPGARPSALSPNRKRPDRGGHSASQRSSATTAPGEGARDWRRSRLSDLAGGGAFFSKEEGIGTCAYLAAYGLFVDPRGRWRGCPCTFALCLWVVGVWRSLRASWGYGVHNMGLYVDPLTDSRPVPRGGGLRRAPIIFFWVSGARWPGENRGFVSIRRLLSLFWWAAVVLAALFLWGGRPIARARSPGPLLGGRYDLRNDSRVRDLSHGSAAHVLSASVRLACSPSFWEFVFDRSRRRASESLVGACRPRRWPWYLVLVQGGSGRRLAFSRASRQSCGAKMAP